MEKHSPVSTVLYVVVPFVFLLGSGASVPGINPAIGVNPRPIHEPIDISVYAHSTTFLRGTSYQVPVELGEYPENNDKYKPNTSSILSVQKVPIATYLRSEDDVFLLHDQARDEPTTRVTHQHFRTLRKTPICFVWSELT